MLQSFVDARNFAFRDPRTKPMQRTIVLHKVAVAVADGGDVAVFVGGVVQIVSLVTVARDQVVQDRIQVPYTPLELAGRDLYRLAQLGEQLAAPGVVGALLPLDGRPLGMSASLGADILFSCAPFSFSRSCSAHCWGRRN